MSASAKINIPDVFVKMCGDAKLETSISTLANPGDVERPVYLFEFKNHNQIEQVRIIRQDDKKTEYLIGPGCSLKISFDIYNEPLPEIEKCLTT